MSCATSRKRPAAMHATGSSPSTASLPPPSGDGTVGQIPERVGGPPRLTVNNFSTFHAREKKLPPDANTQAAINTRLWQFPDRVCFSCVKCRRDNIQSDSVAIDQVHRIILCTACFTRIIRPRTYRPSRIVPFPSLLSWLNYKPSKVMEVSEDITSRPAEAVAPSGDRMAVPTLAGGDQPAKLSRLPAVAMNIVSTSMLASAASVGGAVPGPQGLVTSVGIPAAVERHPCLRVWGFCQHGGTCLFRNAYSDLCLGFLMGLCQGDEAAGGAADRCQLLHQSIYDLPNVADPPPAERHARDLEDEESAWARWVKRRRNSPNSAEWQLWNNGALTGLLDQYVPVATQVGEAPAEVKNEEAGGDAEEVKLNLSDIMSALHSVAKP